MSVNNGMIIGKIRIIQSLQENTARNMIVSVNIASQIFGIIPGIQYRIADMYIIEIVKPQPCHNIRIFFFQRIKLDSGIIIPVILCHGASIRIDHIGFFQFFKCLLGFLIVLVDLSNFEKCKCHDCQCDHNNHQCQLSTFLFLRIFCFFHTFSLHSKTSVYHTSKPEVHIR